MRRNSGALGWRILSLLAMVAFAVNTAVVVVVLIVVSRHQGLWPLARDASSGLVTVVFWRWIALGAADRAERAELPPVEPEEPRPAVPWNVVGGILGALLITSFGVLWVWGSVEGGRQREAVDRLRTDAVAAAREQSLTVAVVDRASAEALTATWAGSDDDPLAALLDVPHATVADASVEDGEALVLLRPDRGAPPCVILRIAADGDIDSLETDRCT